MINLEEEARKRRERLKSSLSKPVETVENKNIEPLSSKLPEINRKRSEEEEEFRVPEGETLLDSSGAEILSLDSKLPDTLEAQVKSLLSPQTNIIKEMDLAEPKDRNSDLKREYERRMTLLNKQTRRAVVDIVRERLEKEAAEEADGKEADNE